VAIAHGREQAPVRRVAVGGRLARAVGRRLQQGAVVGVARDGERGALVLTASIAGYEGQIGQTAYAAAKAGVIGLTIAAARDLSSVGIRVNTIAPGTMKTPIMESVGEEAIAKFEAASKSNDDVAKFAQETLRTLQKHLKTAQSIASSKSTESGATPQPPWHLRLLNLKPLR